jgi:tRNA(Ile)-lysidine synthase
MLETGETVIIGLSGGPDSVCLVYVLNRIKDEYNLSLHAVYVDHNLRPDETPKEIEFCRELCKKLNINFIVKSIDVKSAVKKDGLNKQEAARELRYKILNETAVEVNAKKIALAHNADDQAETLVMRLIRGAGVKGLTGIPPKRGNIIRPLIEVERIAIEYFLDKAKIGFVVDSSNLKTEYLRNRIRLSLMPELKKLNPGLINSLLNTISILQEEERYFETIVTKTLMKLISRKSTRRIELFLSPLVVMDKVILRRILRRAIDEMESLSGIGFVHIEDIINLIKEGRSGDRLYLPKGIRVIKEYSLLIITSEQPVKISDHTLQPSGEVVIKGTGMVINASFEVKPEDVGDSKSSVLIDAETMCFPLKIRSRNLGDFFFPLGFGKKKKLQDFFVDEKVPRDVRDSIPIVVSGNDIVWIAGYRLDERFKVTDKTEKFMRLTLLKGNL